MGLSGTSYGGISLRSLYSLQLAPQISQNWWRLPLFYDVLNATGGGPPWASGEAPSQGVRPFAVAQGASHPAFLGGWWGHVVPNPQKSYLRLVWHQYVVGGGCGCTPVPRKKNGENGKSKFPTLLDRIFARPISPNWYAHPLFFLLSLQSPHQIVPKNAKKNLRIFWIPPPKKKIFRPCHHQNHPNSGVFCIHLTNDAKRPKKRPHIYSKRS